MNLEMDLDHIELQQALRRLLQRECPPSLVRELQVEGSPVVPESLWRAMTEIGFFGVPFDQRAGESSGLVEVGLMYQELGRVLCPTVFFSTMLFGLAIDRFGTDEQRATWVEPMVAGEISASTALWDPSDAGELTPRLGAERRGGTWFVRGTLDFVANADDVDVLLVAAHSDADAATFGFLIDPRAAGVTVTRHRTHGGDVQCRVQCDDVVVEDGSRVLDPDRLARGGGVAYLSDIAIALQCMEMVGGAQHVLDMTVDYVKVRQQFGRPLAAFQALQHRVADMRIAIDAARLTAWQAIWWLDRGEPAAREVLIAKLQANEAYKFATSTAHILWGGMGYIVESDLHLWSQRAKATDLLGGSRDRLLGRLQAVLALRD